MIKSNLSTRPFYNERAVNLWLAVGVLLVLAATVFNVNRILHYSRSDTTLGLQASRDEAEARRLRADAARLRRSVDVRELADVSSEASRANELIDARTFSWTELFNRFEATLPDDVRMTSVRPRLDPQRGTVVTMTVVARTPEDANRFVDNLEATGAFHDARPVEDHADDQGMRLVTIEARYVPADARSDVAATGGTAR